MYPTVIFIIQPVENRQVPAQQIFIAYDYMIKFNKQFSVGALTYPTTPLLLLQHICTLAGVPGKPSTPSVPFCPSAPLIKVQV